MARVRFSPWKKVYGYIEQGFNVPVIFKKYLNFGSTSGEAGYGIREEGGQVQVKHSGGAWTDIGSGGGAAIGGAITGGTAGSVLFVDPDEVVAQNNRNFFWDRALKSLLISDTLGSELLTNGTFTGSATGWTLGSGWAYSSNAVVHSSNGTSAITPSTPLVTILAGYEYEYSVTVSALTVGSVTLAVGGVTIAAFSVNGTYTGKILATANTNLTLTPTNTARLTVDDISLKRLTGGTVATGNSISSTFNSVQGALGATSNAGFIADNPTSATASVMQASPSFLRRGRGWLSNSSASFPFEVQDYSIGQVNTTAYGKWIMEQRGNNGSWTEFLSYDSAPLGEAFTITSPSIGNGSPGTTRNMTIKNNGGSYSWIDFKFSSTVRSNIMANSSGEIGFWVGGGNYVGFYDKAYNGLFSYSYPIALYHQGYGIFRQGVHAGGGNNPTSTLQSAGGLALKVKRVTSNTTLDNTATHWLLDATTSQSCGGTPTYSCGSHVDQSSCEAYNAHGGCYWNAGNSCSAFNYESGMGTCGSTSGCSVDTASCSSAGDESSCNSLDDAYGGSCSWSYGSDCSGLDESTCGSTSGCTVNTGMGDCSAFNGSESSCSGTSGCSISTPNTCSSAFDDVTCASIGCSWDGSSCLGDNSICAGSYSYYTGCSGTYGAGCSGTYNTGNCSGVYGAGCFGTSSCAGISYANCSSEAGCTGVSVMNVNLPDGEQVPDRTYFLYNDSSGGADVKLLPYSGQTIDMTSDLTMANYKDWLHIAYYKKTKDCSLYTTEGACTPSGCSINYSNCSWDSMSNVCSGNTVCDSISDQSTCESTQYFSSCTGTEILAKNWYVFGR